MNHSEVAFIHRSTVDLIRDSFKRRKCQDAILPFSVLPAGSTASPCKPRPRAWKGTSAS